MQHATAARERSSLRTLSADLSCQIGTLYICITHLPAAAAAAAAASHRGNVCTGERRRELGKACGNERAQMPAQACGASCVGTVAELEYFAKLQL